MLLGNCWLTYTNVFIRYIITVILFAFSVPCDIAIERPKRFLYVLRGRK